jgi:VRR-NUC domain
MSLPPLLSIAQGRKPRLRKAPSVRPKEISLHMLVAKILRDYCRQHWLWTHIASGELRDVRTASKLKSMGVRRGWPDFVLVPPTGKLHCLELKRQGETLSEDQENFRLHCVRHGIPYAIARTCDEVLATLDAWGALTIRLAGRAGVGGAE